MIYKELLQINKKKRHPFENVAEVINRHFPEKKKMHKKKDTKIHC